MNESVRPDDARRACERLSHAYGALADAGEAGALADLFTPDGVFDRLGRRIAGRDAIRDFIANRPTDLWQRHHGSGFRFELAADGRSATGQLDLLLERGRPGSADVTEILHARYHDRFVLTGEGWKFSLREVRRVGS